MQRQNDTSKNSHDKERQWTWGLLLILGENRNRPKEISFLCTQTNQRCKFIHPDGWTDRQTFRQTNDRIGTSVHYNVSSPSIHGVWYMEVMSIEPCTRNNNHFNRPVVNSLTIPAFACSEWQERTQSGEQNFGTDDESCHVNNLFDQNVKIISN